MKWLVGLGVAILAFVLASEAIMARVDEPEYETIVSDGRFSVRRYAPMIVATVTVEGARRTAINDGFRILADYIFGNTDGGGKIAMTAPVLQEPDAGGTVLQAPAGANRWEVSFVMPASYTMATLPKPRDSRVRIAEMPAQTVAAVSFSGLPNAGPLDRETAALSEWLAARGMRAVGRPRFAFYDPPWTLPFLRRNEVLIEVER